MLYRYCFALFIALLLSFIPASYAAYPTESFIEESQVTGAGAFSSFRRTVRVSSCAVREIVDWETAGFSASISEASYVENGSGGFDFTGAQTFSASPNVTVLYDSDTDNVGFSGFYEPDFANYNLYEDSAGYGIVGDGMLRIDHFVDILFSNQTPPLESRHNFSFYTDSGFPLRISYYDFNIYDADATDGGYRDRLLVDGPAFGFPGLYNIECGANVVDNIIGGSTLQIRGDSSPGPLLDNDISGRCDINDESALLFNSLAPAVSASDDEAKISFTFDDANNSSLPHHIGIGNISACDVGESLSHTIRLNPEGGGSPVSPTSIGFTPGEEGVFTLTENYNMYNFSSPAYGSDAVENLTAGITFNTLPPFVRIECQRNSSVYNYLGDFTAEFEPSSIIGVREELIGSTFYAHEDEDIAVVYPEAFESVTGTCYAVASPADTAGLTGCFPMDFTIFYEGCADQQTDLGACVGPAGSEINFSYSETKYYEFCAGPAGSTPIELEALKSFDTNAIPSVGSFSGSIDNAVFDYNPATQAFEAVHRLSVTMKASDVSAAQLVSAVDTLVEVNIANNAGISAPVVDQITVSREQFCVLFDEDNCTNVTTSLLNPSFDPLIDNNLLAAPVVVPVGEIYVFEMSYRVSFPVTDYFAAAERVGALLPQFRYGVDNTLTAESCVWDGASCSANATLSDTIRQRHRAFQYQVTKEVSDLRALESGGFEVDFRITTTHDSPFPVSLVVEDNLEDAFLGVQFGLVNISMVSLSSNMNPNYDGQTDIVVNDISVPSNALGDVYEFTVFADTLLGSNVSNQVVVEDVCEMPFTSQSDCFFLDNKTAFGTQNITPSLFSGVAKHMSAEFVSDGTDVGMLIHVELDINVPGNNVGIYTLDNFQLVDVVSDMFDGNSADWRIAGAPTVLSSAGSPTIVLNAGYNGIAGGDVNLLAPGTALDFGESATIGFTIEVDQPLLPAVYEGVTNEASFTFDASFSDDLADPINVDAIAISATDDVSLAVDPSGIVYDETTNEGVENVPVSLYFDTGGSLVLVPEDCLLPGQPNPQLTNSVGQYQFDIDFGNVACPAPISGGGTFVLQYDPTAVGYLPGVTVIDSNDPSIGQPPLNALTCLQGVAVDGGCSVDTDGTPQAVPTSQFYTQFTIFPFSQHVIYNHIPLRQTSDTAEIVITKEANVQQAAVGDFVSFTLRVLNTGDSDASDLIVQDNLPLGLSYVPSSAALDGVELEPSVTGGSQLAWTIPSLAAGEQAVITFITVVNSAAVIGDITNIAAVYDAGGAQISNTARATLEIIPEPIFDCSTVIGRVFKDDNQNGYINDGEGGVPAVRLVTPNGWEVTTDAYGRYHIPCAAIPDEQRGSNFTLKLDPRSLPTGYRITSENPRTIRLTQGKMKQANFGVDISQVLRVELKDGLFAANDNNVPDALASQLEKLLPYMQKKPTIIRISYRNSAIEENAQRERMKGIKAVLEDMREANNITYEVSFEADIVRSGKKEGVK